MTRTLTGFRAAVGALVLWLTSGAAFGQPSRAPIRIFLNDQDLGVVVALLEGSEVWVPTAMLREAGLQVPSEDLRVDRGAAHVRLESLRPDVTSSFDPDTITVKIVAGERAFGARTIDATHQAGARRAPLARASSAFVNYSALRDDLGTAIAGELGVSVKGAFFSAAAIRSNSIGTTVGPVRLTVDDPQRLNRWVIGDQFSPGSALGESVPLVGVSFSRAFEIDPYFVTLPAIDVSAATAVPASVEVYVNDQLVRRERVGAGTFTIEGIAPVVGQGTTRVVVRDALGREREFADSFYQPAGLLADGLQAFSYAVGQRRDRPTGLPDGPVLAMGTHRLGLSDTVTIGGHAAATPGLVSGGPQLALRLPRGELELGIGASAAAKPGGAGHVAYNYRGAALSAGGILELASRGFVDASPYRPATPKRSEAAVFVGGSLGGRLSVTGSYGTRRNWTERSEHRGTLTGFVRLSNQLSASMSLGVSRGPRGAGREAYVGLTVVAPRNHTATMAVSRAGDQNATVNAGVQRSLPLGEGYGYRLQLQEGATRSVTGGIQAQTRYGRLDATIDNFDGSQQSSLGVAGAVAFTAGGIHFTRTIDDAFAVIRVPGQPNVRTYVDGQLVGRTNGRGELVVPHLLSYHDNSITIASDDLPLDANVESGDRIISPGLRNGPSVTFAASRAQRMMGRARVRLATGLTEPLMGDLVLTDGTMSPLGREGQFYFENLPAGIILGHVMFEGASYRCQFEVPASSDPRLMLGDVVCQPIEGRQP